MNKFLLKSIFTLAIIAGLTSCSSGLKPLTSDYIKATPQPLEVVAGKVPVSINATFPENWFNKNASVQVIPVLRYAGGEAWGTSYTYQGEKVAGNGKVIPQKKGANVTMTSSFNYVPAMEKSELYLTFIAKVGNKSVELPEIKIANGVIATSTLANAASETPAIAPDAFQRIINEKYEADIMFLIQQAELRSSELRKTSVEDWKSTVEGASAAPNQKVNVEIAAYASPDGGYELNEKLSQQREKNTNEYLTKELKKAKADVPMYAKYTAQDWEGFKQLVEKSNIQDKQIILSVLSSYKDPEEREKQIKNISSVFSVLADEILPQLRRSRLIANVEIIGKSDEEISKLAASSPKSLSIEELLYAATLVKSKDQAASIYKTATQLFPKDYRAYNNLGVLSYEKADYTSAKNYFQQSESLAGAKSSEVNYNYALMSLLSGDKEKAQQYLGSATNVPQINSGLGLIALENGEYAKAASLLSGTQSNNAALSQIMTKDYSKAMSTLNAVANPDATTSYLKAVVSARTNDVSGAISNLKQSISLNPEMAKKALNDLEFAKFATNSQFLQLVK